MIIVIPVSAQNTTTLNTTDVDHVGLVTVTAQKIDEIRNSINAARDALEQGIATEAFLNLIIDEGQLSVLSEEASSFGN